MGKPKIWPDNLLAHDDAELTANSEASEHPAVNMADWRSTKTWRAGSLAQVIIDIIIPVFSGPVMGIIVYGAKTLAGQTLTLEYQNAPNWIWCGDIIINPLGRAYQQIFNMGPMPQNFRLTIPAQVSDPAEIGILYFGEEIELPQWISFGQFDPHGKQFTREGLTSSEGILLGNVDGFSLYSHKLDFRGVPNDWVETNLSKIWDSSACFFCWEPMNHITDLQLCRVVNPDRRANFSAPGVRDLTIQLEGEVPS